MRNDWISKCLSSLEKSDYPTDVLVIDNDSSDDTVAFVESNFPKVELIKSQRNLGFGAANNIGLEKCIQEGYSFAFLLNQDAFVFSNTLGDLVRSLQDVENEGIISPIHLDSTKNNLEEKFSNFIRPSECPDFYSDCTLNNTLRNLYECNFVNAAVWLIPKILIEKVGGFSPFFFHYGEDSDYCNRSRYHGFKIYIKPTSFAVHDSINDTNSKMDWNEIYFRIQAVNPGLDTKDYSFRSKIKGKRVEFLLALLKLNLKGTIRCWKDLKALSKLINSSEYYKAKNKLVGKNYLNIK